MSGFQELPDTFTTATALARGVHPRVLYALRDGGDVVELSRGVFRRADAPLASEPDLLAVAYRSPVAIVCCRSAAAVHELSDELPRGADRRALGAPPTADRLSTDRGISLCCQYFRS